MNKVSPGLGGRGTAMSIERKEHPKGHFEIGEMRIQKAHDGSFVIKHEMRLKKRHEGKEDYYGSYKEPETHTAQSKEELMKHVQKHFGGGKKAASEAETPEEEAAEGGEEE